MIIFGQADHLHDHEDVGVHLTFELQKTLNIPLHFHEVSILAIFLVDLWCRSVEGNDEIIQSGLDQKPGTLFVEQCRVC